MLVGLITRRSQVGILSPLPVMPPESLAVPGVLVSARRGVMQADGSGAQLRARCPPNGRPAEQVLEPVVSDAATVPRQVFEGVKPVEVVDWNMCDGFRLRET